jgi:hypothetical protein
MLMINPPQVLVAGQKEPTIQQSRLGQNQGIVNFLTWQQASGPDLAGHLIHQGLGAGQFEKGPKPILLSHQLHGSESGLTDSVSSSRFAEKGQFVQDARDNERVVAWQALVEQR